MKCTIACLLAAASTVALAQDIPAPLNVTTLTSGRQEILTLQNQNAGVVTGGGDEADLLFGAKTDAGNVYRIGGVGGVVTNRANATRAGDVVLRCGPGEGMSERLRLTNDGSVVVNGSAAGALRVGTAPTDNRTNTQLQVFSSMAAYASADNAEADVFAADLNYYNNGTPTWAGAGAIWYGKTRSGNLFATTIPLARMAFFLGQNSSTTAFGTNTNNPVYLVNALGVGVTLNPNLTTSFFGNQVTTATAGEVQIGGGQIIASGNVTIGSTAANAKLSVVGTITAKEIKVTSSGADYVFDDGYKLAPLAQVEAFVGRERHLPGVMSAKEMGEAGLPVAEVVTVQLAKIEELTLYAIRQQKVIDALIDRQKERDKAAAEMQGKLAAIELILASTHGLGGNE